MNDNNNFNNNTFNSNDITLRGNNNTGYPPPPPPPQPNRTMTPPYPTYPVKQKQHSNSLKVTLLCLAMLILGGILGSGVTQWANDNFLSQNEEVIIYNPNDNIADVSEAEEPPADVNPLHQVIITDELLSPVELFEAANPAVVAISTESAGLNAFGQTVMRPTSGSGFIISADGYIVTNNHVIERAESISILLYDGSSHPAVIVGRDSRSDLAVLKIDVEGLAWLGWGDSDNARVGEKVAAIGNALGEFANTMTMGYISALNREINIDGTPRNMLQTDAALNSGNSGGPLINMRGQVLGVVTAKSAGFNVEGLGFAIPSSTAEIIINQLIEQGYVSGRPIIGVTVGLRNYNDNYRVFILEVNRGGAADNAGVEEGDMVIAVNDTPINSISDLREIINEFAPGDEITLIVQRDGQIVTLPIILDEYKPDNEIRNRANNRNRERSDDRTPNDEESPRDRPFPRDDAAPFDPDSIPPELWDMIQEWFSNLPFDFDILPDSFWEMFPDDVFEYRTDP